MKSYKEAVQVVDIMTDENGLGYYMAFDTFLNTVCLGIAADKRYAITPDQFYNAIKSFINDIETDQLDLDAIFLLQKETSSIHN